ncbi:uncharacterized protein LOC110833626 isoform X2 [Zootermopsis nevadensis]|uniref:uncharacterized protein LOC110833626 isoform X2 n=1 Tax=Zootermopsis nevadensis TaxID=136037 RepID=UPI000B8E7EC7|nr:uncharacterized protein LOC110833626 isoform X2 [Zootermopsis nevadensis]
MFLSCYGSSSTAMSSAFLQLRKTSTSSQSKTEEDGNVRRIITDMEHTLMFIPSQVNAREKDHIDDIPTRDETLIARPYQVEYIPMKPAKTSHSKPVVLPSVKFSEQSFSRQFKHRLPPSHEQQRGPTVLQSSAHTQLVSEETTSGTQTVQRELEVKCARLECELKQIELTCDQLRKERDALNEKIEGEKEELEVLAKKEKDYLVTINCLSSNLENMKKKADEQGKAVSELLASNAQLKEENKELLPLHDAKAVLSRHLKERSKEEENIHAQLQIMKLEREKFEILLVSKDKEVEKLKQELMDIQAFTSEQLLNLKSFAAVHKTANEIDKGDLDIEKRSIISDDTEPDPLSTEIALSLEKAQRGREMEKQPVCSSPTSTITSSVGIYPAWQNISRISLSHKDDVNKFSSREMFVLPPTRNNNNNMNESENDSGIEGNRSFSFIKPRSPEFKSFLVDSLSENVATESRSESSTIEPKTHEELKNKLRSLFERLKRQTKMGIGVSLPSPPRHCSEISEPSGMSQWSEVSDVVSTSSVNLNKEKFGLSTSDTSFESKFETNKLKH